MRIRIYAWTCTALLMVAGVAFAVQEDPVLGKTGDYVVKRSDVDRLLASYPEDTRHRLRENPAEVQTLVERMLEVKVIADLARKEEFDEQTEIKRQLAYVADDFLSKEYLAKVVMKNATVTEADLKAFYDQNKKALGVPEQVRARHILFQVDPAASEEEKNEARARAEAVLKRLQAGEAFEELARAYSDDQSSTEKGGDLGYFRPGQMVPDFEGVAFFTAPGEISDVVETRYGYHIMKVEDHMEARERSFQEMREVIKERLQQEMVMFKVQEFIRKAIEEAGMHVYPDRISGQ